MEIEVTDTLIAVSVRFVVAPPESVAVLFMVISFVPCAVLHNLYISFPLP